MARALTAAAGALAAAIFFAGCRVDVRDAPTQTRPAGAEEAGMTQAQHDRRIDYIEIPVTDVARAKAFYQGLFGWEFTDYGPDYTSFADGRMTGGLRQADQPAPHGVLLVIYAVDLEAMQAAVAAAGGKILVEPFSFPGGRRFHFVDPAGCELAVWSDK